MKIWETIPVLCFELVGSFSFGDAQNRLFDKLRK